MLPDTGPAVQVPPPAPTQVHVTSVSAVGNVSATVAPAAGSGPALLAVIVYVTDEPAVAVVTPSVLVIARSADPPPALTAVGTSTVAATTATAATTMRQPRTVSHR